MKLHTYIIHSIAAMLFCASHVVMAQKPYWESFSISFQNTNVSSISIDANGNIFIVATNYEVHKTNDYGKNWDYCLNGVMAVFVNDRGNIIAGGYRGMFVSKDGGVTWYRDSVGLSLESITSIADGSKTSRIICGTKSGVFLSMNAGETWERVRLDQNVSYLATIITRNDNLLACGYSKSTYRKRISDTTWANLENTAMKKIHRFLELKDNRILAVGDSGILVSTDDGAQWQVVSSVLKSAFCTSADAYNNSIVLVGTQKRGLLFSQDEGKTWTWKNSGLPDTANLLIYDICIDKSGVAYLATSKGVFRSLQPVTEMQREQTLAASNFVLHQNYPNPFHPSTTIPLEIISERGMQTSLSIWSSSGRKMKTIFEGELTKGLHEFSFDGAGLAAGIYFIKTVIGNEQRILRAHLVK